MKNRSNETKIMKRNFHRTCGRRKIQYKKGHAWINAEILFKLIFSETRVL